MGEIAAALIGQLGNFAKAAVQAWITKPRQVAPLSPPAAREKPAEPQKEVEGLPQVALRQVQEPSSAEPGLVERANMDPETMAYQEDMVLEDAWLLEGHLKQNCIGCSKDHNCCYKHTSHIILVCNETLSMTNNSFWLKLKELATEIKLHVHPDDVEKGTYRDLYPAYVVKVSEFRLELQRRQMARLKPTEVTLEEAKKIAMEEAAKKVEEVWNQKQDAGETNVKPPTGETGEVPKAPVGG